LDRRRRCDIEIFGDRYVRKRIGLNNQFSFEKKSRLTDCTDNHKNGGPLNDG
jgi:hypothetical protein